MNDTLVTNPEVQTPPPAPGSPLPFFVAALVLLAAAYGGFKWWQVRQWEASRGDAIPVTEIGPSLSEFELTERSGEPFRTIDMKGKVWVASYFFTTCPGSCIRLNQNIKYLHNLPDLKDVTFVSITCDPDNDSLDALEQYAENLDADPERWLFVRGELDYTKRVAAGMNVFLERRGHQDFGIVIDKTGKIRGVYDATSKVQCQRMIQQLLECMSEEPLPQDMASTNDDHAATLAQSHRSPIIDEPLAYGNVRGMTFTTMALLATSHPLVHLNASLNSIATILLIAGLVTIKRGHVLAHKRMMLSAFAVSAVFLVSYLWYHYLVGSVRFTHPGAVRYVYLTILLSHVVLAVAVPPLAIYQIYLGYRAIGCCPIAADDRDDLAAFRARHRRWARVTYPIWLYVSMTGVVVYVMLYHLWPPTGS